MIVSVLSAEKGKEGNISPVPVFASKYVRAGINTEWKLEGFINFRSLEL